ncbi:AlpA family phage regulatory protein [Shewanella amazonensis]|uniref:AlpA family phage regulatory protein n=1 Tax=Shewanella litorisediminis TaxID=1173586 RepID=A0ABX7G489_9GAMM|nr:AlpA family phage regulatory protein [Shewanella litorisediminis]
MIFKIKDIVELLTVSRSTLNRMIKKGQFPEPNAKNSRNKFWTEKQLKEWESSLESNYR